MADGGGDRVNVPGGLFSRRRDRVYGGRRRPVDEIINNAEGDTDSLTAFKSVAPFFAQSLSNRPVYTCCLLCFPENKKNIPSQFTSLGIRNCFNVPTINMDNNWFIRQFPHFTHFWAKTDLASQYNFVNLEKVIEDEKFFAADNNSDENQQSTPVTEEMLMKRNQVLAEEKKRALIFLNSFGIHPISERVLGLLIRIGAWLTSRFFQRVFDAVCVHDGQINLLKSMKKNHPVIYVPLQKSHWDSFILNYVLIDSDIPPPLFIGKKSLLENSFLRKLARLNGSLGCLNGRTKNTKNPELDISPGYPGISHALFAYLKSLLKNGMSLEIFAEKHRSTTGKPGTVLVGTELFYFISELVKSGEVEDIICVPVNITYEKLPDENLLDCSKTSYGVFRTLWNLFRKKLGFVRVDFAHPFSIREFQEIVMTDDRVNERLDRLHDDPLFWMTDGYCDPLRSSLLNWNKDIGSVTSLSSTYGDFATQQAPDNQSCLISDTLTYHSIYDSWRTTPFMSTNILAFLLVTRYRKGGASMEILVNDLEELLFLFRDRKHDIGFFSQSDLKHVIQRAANLLGPNLVFQEKVGENSIIYKPNVDRSSLNQLAYYSNPVSSFFAMEGIIATALFALESTKLRIFNDTKLNIFVNDTDLIKKATELAILLKTEFYFHPPCEQLESAIKSTLNRIRDSFLLIPETQKVQQHYDEVDDYDEYEDGGPQSVKLRIQALEDPVVYKKLCQARNIITPYLQVYAEAFKVLYELLPTPSQQQQDGTVGQEEEENVELPTMFELTLRNKMLEKVLESPSVPHEVAVMDTIKNFIMSMKYLGIIEDRDSVEDGKIIWSLLSDFASPKKLNLALDNILSFISF